MKKQVLIIFMTALLLTGCGAATYEKENGEVSSAVISQLPSEEGSSDIISRDLSYGKFSEVEETQNGNRGLYSMPSIMKNDVGYYYYDGTFKVYDEESEKTRFLCNKPECRHDGNNQCAASTSDVANAETFMYDSRILALIYTNPDKLTYSLAEVNGDGSGYRIIADIYTAKDKNDELVTYSSKYIVAHHGKVYVPIAKGVLEETLEETDYNIAIVDLNSGDVSYMYKENDMPAEELKWNNPQAMGDRIFFYTYKGNEKIFKFYEINTGNIKTYHLEGGFSGDYTFKDKQTLLYVDQHYSGIYSNVIGASDFTLEYDLKDYYSTYLGSERVFSLFCDGSNLFIGNGIELTDYTYIESSNELDMFIDILNLNFEKKQRVYNPIPGAHYAMNFTDDAVYVTVKKEEGNIVFRVSKEDFLAGNFKYQLKQLYTLQVEE